MWLGAVVIAGTALIAAPVLAQNIVSAQYLEPTNVYGHGALQDGEYARLQVGLSDGTNLSLTYDDAVFEDTAPRLHDFDKDGAPEVVTVVSTFDTGARIQIFTLHKGVLVPFASNLPIGTRNRWLAIAGIADFNNDGIDEIAYVDRPHFAKVLRILPVSVEVTGGALSEVASKTGLTNHHLGSAMIEGGVRDCEGQIPVILTANSNWQTIVETQLQDGTLHSTSVAPYVGPDSFTRFLTCDDR